MREYRTMASESSQQQQDAEIHSSLSPNFLNKVTFIHGRCGSGKTYLSNYIYHQIQDQVDEVYYFCSDDLAQHSPFPHHYTPHEFPRVFRAVHRNGKNKLFLFDHLGDAEGIVKSKEFRAMIHNGRHCQITVVLSMQYPLSVSPIIRSNVHYYLSARVHSYDDQQKIYSQFGRVPFRHITMMQDFMEALGPYEFMLLDLAYRQKWRLSDIVQKYKASRVAGEELSVGNFPVLELEDDCTDHLIQLQKEFREVQDKMNKLGAHLAALLEGV